MKQALIFLFKLTVVQQIFYNGVHTRLLKKPYTIVVPASLPIAGPVAPLGEMCLKSIEMLLDNVNSRSDILPDYNFAIDIFDDQCMDQHSVKQQIPYFMEHKTQYDLDDEMFLYNRSYRYFLPRGFKLNKTSEPKGYVPPLFIGAMCSAVCKVISSYMQLFDLINVRNY